MYNEGMTDSIITSTTAETLNVLASIETKQTLWECFDQARARLEGSEYTSPEFDQYMHTGGVPYNSEWTRSFELITAKGNVARKGLQMHVIRNEWGTYECYTYIL